MWSWVPSFVGELGGVDDHLGDPELNLAWAIFCSGFVLGKVHQFPNGYSAVFPASYEPPFPRFDLGVAKFFVFVILIRAAASLCRSRRST